MNLTNTAQYSVLGKILEALGMEQDDIEQCAATANYRIDFEKNFTVELQNLGENNCRISARIFSLGKSLQVQDRQLKSALAIYTELLDHIPQGISVAISDHDNCLRLCTELTEHNPDTLMDHFQNFVHVAFAYKQTFFQHKSPGA